MNRKESQIPAAAEPRVAEVGDAIQRDQLHLAVGQLDLGDRSVVQHERVPLGRDFQQRLQRRGELETRILRIV